MTHMPFPKQGPSNENRPTIDTLNTNRERNTPWEPLRASDPPQPMFTLNFHDGRVISFSYADLRETVLRDAGHLKLLVFGFEKQLIVIEGRHLTGLQQLFTEHRVKSIEENGPRSFECPEQAAAIDKISIEILTGGGF